ncbi:MAG TPA: SUMF1/EgtB/PvdO family nonheme iron enzyme [Chitinivibrionales bacterium]|nr:SUMF1/EgtB/PvdO family nonheme iron enzyme [Chitinivibrionales bacterium]
MIKRKNILYAIAGTAILFFGCTRIPGDLGTLSYNNVDRHMVFISGGAFQMGESDFSDAVPLHQVTVSPFFIDNADVVQADYQALMSVNPSYYNDDSLMPVVSESWYDAVLYCNARSKHEFYDTVYSFNYIHGTPGIGCDSLGGLLIDYSKNGYRLPTEAEWEYACRAGTVTRRYWGNSMDHNFCWDSANSGGMPHRVGQKIPNDYGLYDMNGNVLQWCDDWYAAYPSVSQTDPTGPSTGVKRVLRGGSWYSPDRVVSSGSRWKDSSSNRFSDCGFRCVRANSLNAPVPYSPANGATGQSQSLTLSWGTDSGAVWYHVQLSTSDSFATLIVDDSNLTSTSQAVSGLAANTAYYWRVQAKNATGASRFSSPWKFTTVPATALPAPTLLSPANAAASQPLVVALSWTTVTGATGYHVQVSTAVSFLTIVTEDSLLAAPSKTVGNLAAATLYYWRARAKNANGPGAWSSAWSFTTAAGTPDTMKFIGGGTFAMGSSDPLDYNASPPHLATVSSFYIDSAPVTQGDYLGLMAVNPSNFYGSGLRPVEQVTWFDAALYCNARSKRDKRDTVYSFTSITGRAGDGCSGLGNLSIDYTKNGYRLPTEAEFEYAARAGTTTPYFWGSDTLTGKSYAWWKGNSLNNTQQVASKLPNGWNLYDMSGDVWEWCNDWFGTYQSGLQSDPTGAAVGTNRVMRGGSWRDSVGTLRSAFRWSNMPGATLNSYGFRCVRKYFAAAGPQAPSLVSPASGAVSQPLAPALSWSSVAGATSYRLQVSTDSTFASVTIDDSSLVSPSMTPDTLLGGVKYFWRARAQNASGASAWTTAWSFTTVMPALPAAPALVSPVGGSTGQPLSLTFDWAKVSGAATYYIQVSTNALFTTVTFQDSTLTADSFPVRGLSANTVYRWRVRAKNAAGAGAWSSIVSFSTGTGLPPSAPVLNSPANDTTNLSRKGIVLAWSTVTDAVSYEAQVSGDSLFSKYVVDDSTLSSASKTIDSLPGSVLKYFWRVRSKNANGASAWTSVWSFTISAAALPTPVLSAPANGATFISSPVTLSWLIVPGAATYHVQVASDNLFSSLLRDDSALTSATTTVNFPPVPFLVYWRVQAQGAAGASAWSPVWIFYANGTLSAPGLDAPANGTAGMPLTAALSWSAVSGAANYHVQLSTSNLFTAPVADDSTLTTTTKTVSGLARGTTYYWRVQARQQNITSSWTAAWSFTTTTNTVPWVTKKSMPKGMLASAAVVGDKIYVIGGYYDTNSMNVLQYDPAADSWNVYDTLDINRSPAAAAVNGKIYAIGGGDIKTVEEYDPVAKTWTLKADMPTQRGPALAVIDSTIYAVGGYNSISGSLGTNESYNPSANAWTQLTDMTPRNSTPVAAANGKVYAIGGEYWPSTPLDLVQEYDLAANVWNAKTAMPTKRTRAGAATVNGKIYVMGGTDDVSDLAKVECYDPSTDSWTTKASMPTPRWGVDLVVVNNKIYAIGGVQGANGYMTTVEEYDPSLDP